METPRSTAQREHCAACGFDSDLYDRADAVSSQRVIPAVLGAAIEGLDEATLGTRPAEDTWSIAEYIDHVREVAFGNRFAIETALADPGHELGPSPDSSFRDVAATVGADVALKAVTEEFAALGLLLKGLDDDQWSVTVRLDDAAVPVDWFARHVLHEGLHHMADIGRIRHSLGQGATHQTGTVAQINVSNGGVPKQPVPSVAIDASGVGGDSQADRLHHGRPIQAVCLWSTEVIASLQAEGHPIAAGNTGENLTLSGVVWDSLRPGSRLDVGPVQLLVSAYAKPCAKNAQWFIERDFKRMLHDRHPGWSRLYAIPLAPGTVTTGDTVIVEPET